MKIVNRKVLLSLLGIVAATPFMVIALAVGARAAALADSLQGDLLIVALAIGGVLAGISEGRIVLRGESAPARRNRQETNANGDRRGPSTFSHGY